MTNQSTGAQFASLKCRLLCMLYEAVLLFGIFFAAGLLFDLITQNQDAHSLRNIRQLYLFIVLGLYFTYFWSHGGQTLPMKTWHIRLVSANGSAISLKQAGLRYCLAWMWFLPALGMSHLFELRHWPTVALFFAGLGAWALTSRFDVNRQFLHDRIAGTWLVAVPRALPAADD